MNVRSYRLSRVRDFVLASAGGACLAFAVAFFVARIFYRNYFILTNRPDPLGIALGSLALTVLLGVLHAFSGTPLPPRPDGTYNDSAER